MYKGEITKGEDFYNLLFESDSFTSELGKVSLAAGKLEAELITFLKNNNVSENVEKATLGKLIKICKDKKLSDKNLIAWLEIVLKQRNYLTHNIYALFINLIEETLLPKNIIDTDILTFTDKAFKLRVNLSDLAEMIKIENNKILLGKVS